MGKKKDKQIIVRLICVALSFALWLYITNVENPTRTSTLKNVPITIINKDSLKSSNLALVEDQDLSVDLKLEGSANDIYSVKKSEFKLKVDLGQYTLKKGDNNIPVEVVDSPSDISIKNSSVVSIKIRTEEIIEKEFNIVSEVTTNFKNGHSMYSEIISPETVNVKGAESQVKKVSKVVLYGEENNISESFTKKYKLKAVDSEGNEITNVEISRKTAELSINVAMSKEVELRVKYSNPKEGVIVNSVTPSKKMITIVGDKNVIDSIDHLDTEEIDISNIENDYKVNANIICPKEVKISGESTVSVQFLITDNQLKNKTINGVKITYTDKDDNKYNYELPENVDIVVNGTKDQINQVNSSNIVVEASLKDLGEGNHQITWSATIANNNGCTIINNNGKIDVKVNLK